MDFECYLIGKNSYVCGPGLQKQLEFFVSKEIAIHDHAHRI